MAAQCYVSPRVGGGGIETKNQKAIEAAIFDNLICGNVKR